MGLASLFSCLDFCPACLLSGCNSLAPCSRNCSLFPGSSWSLTPPPVRHSWSAVKNGSEDCFWVARHPTRMTAAPGLPVCSTCWIRPFLDLAAQGSCAPKRPSPTCWSQNPSLYTLLTSAQPCGPCFSGLPNELFWTAIMAEDNRRLPPNDSPTHGG